LNHRLVDGDHAIGHIGNVQAQPGIRPKSRMNLESPGG
jgi:hypothetical protein